MMMKHYSMLLLLSIFSYGAFAQDNCATAAAIIPGYYIVDAVNGTEIPAVTCSGRMVHLHPGCRLLHDRKLKRAWGNVDRYADAHLHRHLWCFGLRRWRRR